MSLKKFKQINYKKVTILFLIFLLGAVAGYLVLYPSYAYYEENKNFDVINGTVEDPGDIYFTYYIDGIISRNMPSQNTGYTLDTEKSNCNNGVIPTWDNAGWKFIGDYHSYNGVDNTRTKCTLYFNKTSKIVFTALGNIEVNTYTPDFTKSACDDESCESHEKGIYETTDYDGNPTYYYRGSVENNYVKFAGFYWRIIRINSNGSIRMIYDGTSAHANGEASEDRQYESSKFNSQYTDNMYVGYMYTQNETNGLSESSTIKSNADNFFVTNLINYQNIMDINSGYCNDRRTISARNNPGVGQNDTIYQGYQRAVYSSPELSCQDVDLFTLTSSLIGNKALTYPVGLITMDELLLTGFGGGAFEGVIVFQKKGYNTFLNTGMFFWTMTPIYGTYAIGDGYWTTSVFLMADGKINDFVTTASNTYLKPVINIRSDVKITGSGTMNDPYIIN